ncbi:MAG: hypothetical protein GX579_07670 [Chloroflexi bacterium]|nr:hypothetical protein [Chloroflexota bacterium]
MWGEALPASGDLLVGGVAGIIGAIGLVTLYRALATMAMGLVAPLTAVVAAGLPAPQHFLGFAAALAGVWFISRGSERTTGRPVRPRDLLLPLFAGATFGLFFILIDQVSDRAVYWPLVAARTASITLIAATILANPGRVRPAGAPPLSRQLPLLALTGAHYPANNQGVGRCGPDR